MTQSEVEETIWIKQQPDFFRGRYPRQVLYFVKVNTKGKLETRTKGNVDKCSDLTFTKKYALVNINWVRTKHETGVHGHPLWTGSMDHFHGPGPWTPCHWPGPWTFFFIFMRRFCTRFMDTQKRFDETLSTNTHDWSQIFSCAYLTYTLLAHVQSQDC